MRTLASGRTSAPRARGGGPGWSRTCSAMRRCSPRTRGWSPHPSPRRCTSGVLPAHAGVVPGRRRPARRGFRAPRARGGGPVPRARRQMPDACSPRTRGWSQPHEPEGKESFVLPAHAGVVPGSSRVAGQRTSAPRARGGGPVRASAPARTCPCSPRTRGWSRVRLLRADAVDVLPAHAGVVPTPGRSPAPCTCAPRARGGGPYVAGVAGWSIECSPRTRGWSRTAAPRAERWCRAPRARGGGPGTTVDLSGIGLCSPRTRGWSHADPRHRRCCRVLPAHAGVVPGLGCAGNRTPGAPPAHAGVVPCSINRTVRRSCSPRTRGWSRGLVGHRVVVGVLPAHAGVVPGGRRPYGRSDSAPRARGGGPSTRRQARTPPVCSPRTRGWSHEVAGAGVGDGVLPAHAGVVPGSTLKGR